MHDLFKSGFGDSINTRKQCVVVLFKSNTESCSVFLHCAIWESGTADLCTQNSLYIPVKTQYVHFLHSCRTADYLVVTLSVPDNKWQFCSGDVHLFSGRPVIYWSGKPFTERTHTGIIGRYFSAPEIIILEVGSSWNILIRLLLKFGWQVSGSENESNCVFCSLA